MSDLMWHTSWLFHEKTGDWPYLCFDNNKIQKNIDVTNIPYPDDCTVPLEKVVKVDGCGDDGAIHLPSAEHKIPLPTHSPDGNGPVEHAFSYGKSKVRNHLYFEAKRITTGDQLRKAVRKQFEKLPPGSVAADVARLPLLWEMLSTDVNVLFEADDGKVHAGTGGNWAGKGW